MISPPSSWTRLLRGVPLALLLGAALMPGCGSSPEPDGSGGQSSGGGGSDEAGSGGDEGDGSGGEGGSGGGSGGEAAGGNAGAGGTASGGATGTGGDGSGGDGGLGGFGGVCTEADETSEEVPLALQRLDLIVAVDSSGSMEAEVADLQTNLNSLMAALASWELDPHLILIAESSATGGICAPAPLGSGSCPDDENLPAYRHVDQAVGSTNALELIVSQYPEYESSLRPDAFKSFLVVTDDDSDMSADDFVNSLAALDPPVEDFRFHTYTASGGVDDCTACMISCGGCTNICCDQSNFCAPIGSARGLVYEALQEEFGGQLGELCWQDIAPVLEGIPTIERYSADRNCTLALPEAPNGVDALTHTNVSYTNQLAEDERIPHVNSAGACGSTEGWFFAEEGDPTAITLCPLSCNLAVAAAAEPFVTVHFGCPTE